MVSEALDGLTDEQLADLELQESGLVSGQNEGAIASTPFAQRTNPQPAPAPEPEEPVALSDYELNQLEEESYRRIDYVMTPQEFDQYWDRREKEDNEVGRFLDGLGQGAAGLIGMVPEAGRELRDGMVGMVTDPVNQAQRNIQTGAEIIRKGGINLVQLFDWVSNKVDDVATSSKRAEAINAGIRAQLQAEGRFTGDRAQDEQIYQAALAEAREAGAYKPTADQVREDRGKAYERYVREKALERDFANVSDFKTGESQMSVPTSAEDYQITDEQPMPTISTLGSMAVDPLNALPLGAGALSKARVMRRIANLSEKPLMGAERAASGLADVAERIELGISTRLQDITGLTQKQQAALGAGLAGTAVYVDSATEGGGGLTKAVMMAGGVLPALHYGGGLLRKVGSAAGGAATIVREAGVGGLGVARAEAASNLAGNAAIPERYRKFFTGYVDGTDSTLKRVAQNADNPEALRRVSRFADRMGATQVARVADDAVSGAVTAGIVGTPFAALQPDAERAGEVMGGILTLGAAGGVAGGLARRRGAAADADIARMFADVQAVGGNVEAFARLPHATLDRLAAMQGVLAGKVDFVPLTGDEYRMNADIAQNGGEATAGVFLDRDANNRARVFINLDGKTATDAIAPHEIGHAILTSNVLDGQPRNDLRNLVNQQYGPEGVEARGREYIARMVDADLRQGVTGEAPTVLTEAEMKAMEGGKTMDDIVADRAKDPAERDRLINERMEEFRQRSIDKGEDAMDWARDEIIAETFASEAPAIDFRAIRRDAMFPRLAESMLSAGGRVLEVFGANLSSTGKLMDSPSVLFRDNPLFQDRIMQKRVREYVRSYDQYLAGLEEAGAKELRGVELARSSKPEDLARSTHVKLRDEGRGVLENDFLFQKPDGTYSLKPQKIITATENARSAQIKTLYDARKFVPVNSQEFGKRKVNGREVIGGPVLPPQFDLFTNFPKHVREFARQMERSREEGGSWDIDYNAIGTGASGRYRVTNLGNVRAIQRETVPYGWIVSKANHLLAASLDLNAFRASAMKAINKGDLGLFNNDMRQVEADLKTYLANHRNGLPGEAGIGQQKRDMLNGLIGTGTAVQRTANPLYSDLNPRGSIRTWRVDRLNDAKPTGRTGYFFDYDKINNNRMPSALPQAGMAMPEVPVRGERADIPLNPRARRAAFISDRGEVRSTGRATHFETNEDLGPDFLAIGAGHLGEDGFFRFGSQTMDDAMGDSPATSAAAAARFNQSLYDQGRRPSAMLEEPPGLERASGRGQTGQAMPDTDQPRRYVSMEKFIQEAGDDLDEVLANAYSDMEINEDRTGLVGFGDTRNSMYRGRIPVREFFDWLHSDEPMRGMTFEREYKPATAGEGASHTRESYQALIDRLRKISLKPSKQGATGRTRGQAMPDVGDVSSGLPRRSMQSRGKTQIADDGTITYNGKEPADWTPEDFAAFGKEFGVRNLGPLSEVTRITDELGRDIASIPGGLNGEFTYYDLLWLKANPVDVASLPVELHGKLTAKLARTMTPEPGNKVQKFNGIVFGFLSANAPLLPNEMGQSRLRFGSMKEIEDFGNLLPDNPTPKQLADVNTKLKKELGFSAAEAGGMGIGLSQDLSNVVMAAKLFSKNPDFFIKRADESWGAFVDKVSTQLKGLGTKTASFGTVWQDPLMAAISAMDRHMSRVFSKELLTNPAMKQRFEGIVVKRFNSGLESAKKVAKSYEGKIKRAKNEQDRAKLTAERDSELAKLPDPRAAKAKTIDDVLAQAERFGEQRVRDFVNEAAFSAMGTRKGKYITSKGDVNPNVPESLRGVEWVQTPQDFQVMSDAYRAALELNEARAKDIGIEVFPAQWTLWDRIRQRVEPHEAMFPGLEKLPALNDRQLGAAFAANKAAGYMTTPEQGKTWRRQSGISPSSLAYFTPAVLAAGAAVSAMEEQ